MEILDKRYLAKHKDVPVRHRLNGAPSTSAPPAGAPSWAVTASCIQSNHFAILCSIIIFN